MNQAPTEEEAKSYREIKHLQNKAVGLMNQAPTKRALSLFRLKSSLSPFSSLMNQTPAKWGFSFFHLKK